MDTTRATKGDYLRIVWQGHIEGVDWRLATDTRNGSLRMEWRVDSCDGPYWEPTAGSLLDGEAIDGILTALAAKSALRFDR